jgi:hypothetical protein
MNIYPNTNYSEVSRVDHPIFQAVENEFNNWIDNSNPALEYHEQYFSDEAIYSKKQAIQGAISEMIDEAQETGAPVKISSFDFDAVFS